ncbi:MAG: M28 family peptidase [Bacteroidales bacterium]|nr:M28 family peptidase [Bacteroidales bacterium]MDY6347226.1 M28 family peptidase [Bacteroidales bacterium]
MRRIAFCLPLVAAIVAVAVCVSCGEKKNGAAPVVEEFLPLPAFDADSAYMFVKAQTDFGPRTLGSTAHDDCGYWLSATLARFCDTVYEQRFTSRTYDGKSWNTVNYIGSFLPSSSDRIVLAAHWDSRPFADHDPDPANRDKAIDGANDGASGVGVLLEIARQLSMANPTIGVDIVLFDAEDYGPRESEHVPGEWWGLGAQHWAKNMHVPGYSARFGILLDMVGSPNPRFLQEQFSLRDAPDVVRKVWSTAYSLGHGDFFQNKPGGIITDDHYYVNKHSSFKMIDIIHYDAASGTGFHPSWHTVNDNISNIDKNSLKIVGTTVIQVIRNEEKQS